jgi:hypothetical protein
MGILFDFLQYFGSLGQMVKNIVETYQRFQNEDAENDLERFFAMAVARYLHPGIPNREINRQKVIERLYALIEWGEPVGLYGFCSAVAWAEMDVHPNDIDTHKNILKIIQSFRISYDEAYGRTYEAEDFYRLVKKFNL